MGKKNTHFFRKSVSKTSTSTKKRTKKKTIIPVKLKKGELGKYGYRNIKDLSDRKRHEALKKAVLNEGYLPILRRVVVIRTFNKSRRNLYDIYDNDVKWLQKNKDKLLQSKDIKSVKVKKRGGSTLIITQLDANGKPTRHLSPQRNRMSKRKSHRRLKRKSHGRLKRKSHGRLKRKSHGRSKRRTRIKSKHRTHKKSKRKTHNKSKRRSHKNPNRTHNKSKRRTHRKTKRRTHNKSKRRSSTYKKTRHRSHRKTKENKHF